MDCTPTRHSTVLLLLSYYECVIIPTINYNSSGCLPSCFYSESLLHLDPECFLSALLLAVGHSLEVVVSYDPKILYSSVDNAGSSIVSEEISSALPSYGWKKSSVILTCGFS